MDAAQGAESADEHGDSDVCVSTAEAPPSLRHHRDLHAAARASLSTRTLLSHNCQKSLYMVPDYRKAIADDAQSHYTLVAGASSDCLVQYADVDIATARICLPRRFLAARAVPGPHRGPRHRAPDRVISGLMTAAAALPRLHQITGQSAALRLRAQSDQVPYFSADLFVGALAFRLSLAARPADGLAIHLALRRSPSVTAGCMCAIIRVRCISFHARPFFAYLLRLPIPVTLIPFPSSPSFLPVYPSCFHFAIALGVQLRPASTSDAGAWSFTSALAAPLWLPLRIPFLSSFAICRSTLLLASCLLLPSPPYRDRRWRPIAGASVPSPAPAAPASRMRRRRTATGFACAIPVWLPLFFPSSVAGGAAGAGPPSPATRVCRMRRRRTTARAALPPFTPLPYSPLPLRHTFHATLLSFFPYVPFLFSRALRSVPPSFSFSASIHSHDLDANDSSFRCSTFLSARAPVSRSSAPPRSSPRPSSPRASSCNSSSSFPTRSSPSQIKASRSMPCTSP
ncbi:hypothetical protein B0H17DRAFT_1209217 [Mycena rosella]|uniref:Uncharacterized protein n=1 Tax=Mycena rosella TaxID=1033263 RepID=A0AAD7G5Y8_MYCRO|nr:hypothetical protein B0H17DRAFT_1209217 [Mycena rosella]